MVQPTKAWPEPSVPVPAELPSDVFYVIVHNNDDGIKKAIRRRRYTNYIKQDMTTGGFRTGDTPTLFNNKAEAELNRQSALDFFEIRTSKDRTLELQPFRIVESDWHPNMHREDLCEYRDARRMARGILNYNVITEHVKKLAGKVLTILDAAYVNENQNKAVKDLVKTSFRSQLSDLWDKAHEDPDSDSCEGESGQKDILD